MDDIKNQSHGQGQGQGRVVNRVRASLKRTHIIERERQKPLSFIARFAGTDSWIFGYLLSPDDWLGHRVSWSYQCSDVSAADGSLLDVTLLAAVAALSSLRLPAVRVNDDGNVVPEDEADNDGGEADQDAAAKEAPEQPTDRCCLAYSVLWKVCVVGLGLGLGLGHSNCTLMVR